MGRSSSGLFALAILFAIVVSSEEVLYKPGYEYVYEVSNLFKSGIHQLKPQYAYNEFQYVLKVIALDQEQLVLKTENIILLEEEDVFQPTGQHRGKKSPEQLPSEVQEQFQAPVICHYKNEKFERLETPKSLPPEAVNFKKYQCGLFQVAASHRQHEHRDVSPLLSRDHGQAMHFFVDEQQLQGDCYTEYQVHHLPRHQFTAWDPRLRSAVRRLCPQGPFLQVLKTTNTSTCSNDPSIHYGSPPSFQCQPGGNSCANIMQRGNVANYVGCGGTEGFIPLSIRSRDTLVANLQLVDAEDASANAQLNMQLLEARMAPTDHFPPRPDLRTYSNLYFRWPGAEYENEDGSQVKLPKLDQAPLTPYGSVLFSGKDAPTKDQVVKKVIHYLDQIPEIFDFPNSVLEEEIGSQIQQVVRLLRLLNFFELHQVKIQAFLKKEKKVRMTFVDAISMAGTNPSIKLVQNMIRSGELRERDHWISPIMINLYSYIMTPTKELLQHIMEFVQWTSSQEQESQLEVIALVNFADLLHRTCIHPRLSHFLFPKNIYEFNCDAHSDIVQKFYRHVQTKLRQALNNDDNNDEYTDEIVRYLMTLNRLGHPDTVQDLLPILEGKASKRPLVRAEAVYALTRLALATNRAAIAYVLEALILDECEHPDVRVAAINVLLYSAADPVALQQLALMSHQRLNRKVHCYLQSITDSLKDVRDPYHQFLRKKAIPIRPLIKEIECGLADSFAYVHSDYIYELELGYFVELNTHAARSSLFPRNIFIMYNFQPGMLKNFIPYQLSTWFDTLRGVKEQAQKTFDSQDSASNNQEQSQNMDMIKRLLSMVERPMSPSSTAFFSEKSYDTKSKILAFSGDWSRYLRSDWQRIVHDVMDNGAFFHWRSMWFSEEHTLAYPSAMGVVAQVNFDFPSMIKLRNGLHAETKPDLRRRSLPIVPNQVNLTAFVDASYYWQLYGSVGFLVPATKKHVGSSVAKQVIYNAQGLFEVCWDRKQQNLILAYSFYPHIEGEVTGFHAQQKPKTMASSLDNLRSPDYSAPLVVVNERLPEVIQEYGSNFLGINAKINYTLDTMEPQQSLLAAVMEANTPSGFVLAPWAIPTVAYGSINAAIDVADSKANTITLSFSYHSRPKTGDKTYKSQHAYDMYKKQDIWESSESSENQSDEVGNGKVHSWAYELFGSKLPNSYYYVHNENESLEESDSSEENTTLLNHPGKGKHIIWDETDENESSTKASREISGTSERPEKRWKRRATYNQEKQQQRKSRGSKGQQSTTPDGSADSYETSTKYSSIRIPPPYDDDSMRLKTPPPHHVCLHPVVHASLKHLEQAAIRVINVIASGNIYSVAFKLVTSNQQREKHRQYEGAAGLAVDNHPSVSGFSGWLRRKSEDKDPFEAWNATLDVSSKFPVPSIFLYKTILREDSHSQSSLKLTFRKGSIYTDVYINGTFKRAGDMDEYAHKSSQAQYCDMYSHKTSQVCLDAIDQALTLNHYELAINYDGKIPAWLANATALAASALVNGAYNYVQVNPLWKNKDVEDNEALIHVHFVPGTNQRLSAEIKLNRGIATIKSPHVPFGPMKMGSHFVTQVANKILAKQYTPYCYLEKGRVNTFDDFTYEYDDKEVGNCYLVAAMDCSMYSKFSLLIKPQKGQYKEMKAYFGERTLEIKVLDGEDRPSLHIDGNKVEVTRERPYTEMENDMYEEAHTVLVALRKTDGELLVSFEEQDGLEVITDGTRYRIAVPNSFRNLTCGLCGDLNGEQTGEMKSPKDCILDDPNVMAASYAVTDEKCEKPKEANLRILEEQNKQCEANCMRGTPVDSQRPYDVHGGSSRKKSPEIRPSSASASHESEQYCNPVGTKREINMGGSKCKSSKIRTCPKGCTPNKQRSEQVTLKCSGGKTMSQKIDIDISCTRE